MAYPTLSEVKSYLDITTTADDAFLTVTLAAVIEAIEQYCQRKFELDVAAEETFVAVQDQKVFYLPRFPVQAITSVVADGTSKDLSSMMLDKPLGKLILPYGVTADEVVITYSGGLDPIPPVIQQTIYEAVKILYAGKDSAPEVGAVKSERIDGVATIAYYDSVFGQALSSDANTIIGGFTINLDPYMSELAIGSAF